MTRKISNLIQILILSIILILFPLGLHLLNILLVDIPYGLERGFCGTILTFGFIFIQSILLTILLMLRVINH